jgi:hypothetical protein
LEKRIGASAYKKCTGYRVISSVFMTIAGVNYVLYYWFPHGDRVHVRRFEIGATINRLRGVIFS